jgi:hypothetical protein
VRPLAPRDALAAAPAETEPEMIELSDERRAKLIEMVEGNTRMPEDVRNRMLTQLKEDKVPAQMVERLESRMGG